MACPCNQCVERTSSRAFLIQFSPDKGGTNPVVLVICQKLKRSGKERFETALVEVFAITLLRSMGEFEGCDRRDRHTGFGSHYFIKAESHLGWSIIKNFEAYVRVEKIHQKIFRTGILAAASPLS